MRRLKGINPIEQHVEKIVVGVFALALLTVLAWQFLQESPKTKVGKAEVPLAEAYDRVAQEARGTEAKIKVAEPPELPKNAGEAMARLSGFEDRYKGPVAPAKQLAAALDRPATLTAAAGPARAGNVAVLEFTPPAPARPVAAGFMATVSPVEAQNPDVAKVLPAKSPMDKAAVSVEATFDGTALRAALAAKPDAPAVPIPQNWWDGSTQIMAVLLEREEQQADGTWSGLTRVPAMPGRRSLAGELDKLNNAADLKARVREVTDRAAEYRRPPYYAVAFGDEWMAPREREAAELAAMGNEERISRLQVKRRGHQETIKRLEQQLQGPAGGGARPGDRPPPATPPRGGGAGGRGGGAPAPAPTPTPDAGTRNPEEQRRKNIQDRLTREQSDLAKVEDELRTLGVNIPQAANAANPGAAAQPVKPAVDGPLLSDAAVRVWAHDVFVERGKTYRYRVLLALTNPYFGHNAAMLADQAERLAAKGVVYTPASDWSDPVSVDPETYLFFTRANEDDPRTGGPATAQAEVFQFAWGRWRKAVAQVEPGDRVIADLKLPDYTNHLAPVDPAQPPAAPHDGGAPQPGPGGGRGGRGGAVAPVPAPAPANRPGDNPNQAPAGGAVPVHNAPVTTDMIMLGVTDAAVMDGQTAKTVPQVLLRDGQGRVITRVPEDERSAAAYGRVSRSAERGDRELRQGVEPRRPSPGGRPDDGRPEPLPRGDRDQQPPGGG